MGDCSIRSSAFDQMMQSTDALVPTNRIRANRVFFLMMENSATTPMVWIGNRVSGSR